jgi:hypothetical protein
MGQWVETFVQGGVSISRITAIIILALAFHQPATSLPAATCSCVLAILPSYVVSTAQLEAVYCSHYNGQCEPYPAGWIVVSDAVPCC